jgi:hypothetical protein
MTMWRMRIACLIHRARNIRSRMIARTRLNVIVRRTLPVDTKYTLRYQDELHVLANKSSRHHGIHKIN